VSAAYMLRGPRRGQLPGGGQWGVAGAVDMGFGHTAKGGRGPHTYPQAPWCRGGKRRESDCRLSTSKPALPAL